jgi:hypothetical protein
LTGAADTRRSDADENFPSAARRLQLARHARNELRTSSGDPAGA